MTHAEVAFRMWRESGQDEVIALFPYEIADYLGSCCSYMHVGQHSSAFYNHVMSRSRPATELEYADLKTELENIGYKLKIIQRRNHEKYIHLVKKAREFINGRKTNA